MAITLTPSSPSGTDLISTARAAFNSTLSALNTSNPSALAALISAASQQIERVCKRQFTLQGYTEVYSGGGQPYMDIQLDNFPVVEITRIATNPQPVLKVINTDQTTNQRATVSTTSTGLRLVRVASAVTTTSDLAFATYPTLTGLVNAVIAVGHGFSAAVASSFGLYPSADLLPLQGAATVFGGADLELYTEDSPAWSGNYGGGWRCDGDSGHLVGKWPQGNLNIRIDYRAGFSTIPDPIQEACTQHAADLYQSGQVDSNLQSESIGPYSRTLANRKFPISATVMGLIGPYIDHAKLHNRHGTDQ